MRGRISGPKTSPKYMRLYTRQNFHSCMYPQHQLGHHQFGQGHISYTTSKQTGMFEAGASEPTCVGSLAPLFPQIMIAQMTLPCSDGLFS